MVLNLGPKQIKTVPNPILSVNALSPKLTRQATKISWSSVPEEEADEQLHDGDGVSRHDEADGHD